MTSQQTTWKNDPTEPFSPPVYRRGIWHFQAHAAAVVMLLSTWFSVAAFYVLPEFPTVLGWLQFVGLVLGTVMTLFVVVEHINRAKERKNYMPCMTPYTIGILEHMTVLGFFILVVQLTVSK